MNEVTEWGSVKNPENQNVGPGIYEVKGDVSKLIKTLITKAGNRELNTKQNGIIKKRRCVNAPGSNTTAGNGSVEENSQGTGAHHQKVQKCPGADLQPETKA